ncbi:myosin-3-like protein isoform X2 [Cinnamomum micranthum f. kanehirae]|uniref:Myosin-3-like protein isoform X2 n=1 Tax=Cinnamomum micranthum f. kanehirae TaxID=337451 RepID=A0A443NVY0_9MAGN|nr:myosin-3-like protein isoform X2 [Cinnamomum micranthum f. kanehirae]
MAIRKLSVFSIFLSLLILKIAADSSIKDEILTSDGSVSPLKLELEQLKLKISVLESSTEDRTQELNRKDESIARMEKNIQEKSNTIARLQSDVELLQKKGTVDAEELAGKAYARAGELEKQIEKLKSEIKEQNRRRDALETQASEAEKKIQELSSKLEKLQKINNEQKTRIRKTERALQAAEEEMMNAKLEATSKINELTEIHGAWLPTWLSIHLSHFQSIAVRSWNEHGRPALDGAIQKASEKSAQAQKWAEPHLETVKSRWVPALKEQWLTFTVNAEPYVQSVSTRTIEFYESSKTALTPHVVKAQELANPYFQEAKKLSKPYIDQVATITKPHVNRVRVALKPYTKKAVHISRKFLKSATVYHHQVQGTIQETLKKHEMTKPLATKEFVWFTASALLALPAFFLYKLALSIFCKGKSKPIRSSNTNHAPRKHKRRHADK